MSIPVTRLNHAVLYVRDLDVAVSFYRTAFGFEEIAREGGGRMALLRARGSQNHHDLGLMAVGAHAPRPPLRKTGRRTGRQRARRRPPVAAASPG